MSEYNPQDPAAPGAPLRWSASSTHVPSPSVQATMHQMTEQLQTVIDAAERAAEAIRYDAEEQARRHLAEAQRKADRLTAERVGLISELTDDLVRHAANVRDHSEQMVRALEDAITSVTDKLEQPAMTDLFPSSEPPGPSLPFGETIDAPTPVASSPAVGSGSYTDLVGDSPAESATPQPAVPAPPPPGAPAPAPPGEFFSERTSDDPDAGIPPDPSPEADPPAPAVPPSAANRELPLDAILYATRLALNGTDPAVIASELSVRYGIEDPEPIVERVLGNQ